MQAHSLKGMFLVLAIGLGLGALVAVLELITKSRRGAAEQKVSFSMIYVYSNMSDCEPSANLLNVKTLAAIDGFLCV